MDHYTKQCHQSVSRLQFVSKAGAFELVRISLWTKRHQFIDGKVSTIHRNQTDTALVSQKAIVPNDLYGRKKSAIRKTSKYD